MSEPNMGSQTRSFYERYQFPGNRLIDQDGLIFLRYFTKTISEIVTKNSNEPIRVLDAGCGTGNTSIALANSFQELQFLGIDQSKNSLRLACAAAKKKGLRNLQFLRWELMTPLPKTKTFNVVLCLGVLHHTKNMKKVLVNLRQVITEEGYLFLWIYAKHGRSRHTLNTCALKYLVKGTTRQEALNLAIEFVRHAGKGAMISDLLGKTPVDEMQRNIFEDPVWIADQFLNPHEELLDMEGVLELVKDSGFSIGQILGNSVDAKKWLSSPVLLKRYLRLKRNEQLIVLDLLEKPERYFLILRRSQRMKD